MVKLIERDSMRVYIVYRMEWDIESYISGVDCVTMTEDKAKEIVNKLNEGVKDYDRQAYYHFEDVIE